MARIHVNNSCNILTDYESNSFRAAEGMHVAPQITIPQFRARLSIREAEALASQIAEAVTMAKAIEQEEKPR